MTGAFPLPYGQPEDRAQHGESPLGPEVGDFRQGTPASRWALSRYLVGRALAAYLDRAMYALALLILVVGALAWWAVSAWLGAPLVLVGLSVLGVRALIATLLRGMIGAGRPGPGADRVRALVADTEADVRRELRRIGLPSRSWTLPLLVYRLTGTRRARTLERLREFRADNVVSARNVDELHLLLRQGLLP